VCQISVKRISGAYRVVAFSEQEMFEKVQVSCAVFICSVIKQIRQSLVSISRVTNLRIRNSRSDVSISSNSSSSSSSSSSTNSEMASHPLALTLHDLAVP